MANIMELKKKEREKETKNIFQKYFVKIKNKI